jgi:uroporphyrinogen decarboxylase
MPTTMTSRERLLAAMRNEVPDRVPAAPDISTYIPIKRTGQTFWDFFFKNTIPLWQAYLEAADYYGLDPWAASVTGAPFVHADYRCEAKSRLEFLHDRDAMLRRTTISTPDGPLTQEEVCFRGDPPTTTRKLIKDLSRDFKRFRWVMAPPTGLDADSLEAMRLACRNRNVAFGVTVCYPGFHAWNSFIQGGIEALSYAEADNPEMLQEWFEMDLERGKREMELILRQEIDYILFGGSGTITLASPGLAAKYAIPALKLFSRMAKQAGVPTMLHSCGKCRLLADMLAAETDVGMLNPLEGPPMGDVDLAELKSSLGRRLAMMGNLHTTDVMLRGTPRLVEQKAIEAMRAAGAGGGFILSTGDQCGRNTPDENIFAVVEAAHKYGRYDRATGTLPDLP